ncbi:MAG TPA: tRNA (adenosine(37)-N6)-dimethylallyltransferase MiaA [Candidatus Dormibacteraeota bacterium]|nr:tRNA (adenosine(37)-N6)-dimethylallyltransferase MiaA [Candidatus Dormibacteraeota bacterium]
MAIVGPTASGKTELAIGVAERLNGELVSMDSRQVFRHCDIGTNKPTRAELRGLALHGVGVVDPDQPFTVADYQRVAVQAISEIAARGRLPVLQGGTGLYLRAVLDGWNLGDAPPAPAIRAALAHRLDEEGPDAIDAELRRIDPAAADRARRNPRRMIRALEIHAVTGRAPSEARESNPPPWSTTVLGLDVPLAEIDQRIEARVHRMIDEGWIDEIRRISRDFPTADLRRLGHGYPEMAAYIDGGLTLEAAHASTVRQVRQYARRQLTWFRADPRVTWIPPDPQLAIERLGTGIMTAEAS